MFLDELRTTVSIAARAPAAGLDQELDASRLGHAEQAEAEQAAQFPNAGIVLAPTPRALNREPDLVADGAAVDALQNEFEIEAELEFGDDDDRRRGGLDRHDVAAANLAFRREAELLEKALHRRIERAFQMRPPRHRAPAISSSLRVGEWFSRG
jgi:hypothetical protein